MSCWSTGAGCRGVTYVGECAASVQIDRAEVWNPGHGYEVRRISLTFDYPKCLEASLPQFMQKYGKPASQTDSLVHKSTGEATKNTTLVWQDDETVLTVKTRSSLHKSSVTLALKSDTTKPAAL